MSSTYQKKNAGEQSIELRTFSSKSRITMSAVIGNNGKPISTSTYISCSEDDYVYGFLEDHRP